MMINEANIDQVNAIIILGFLVVVCGFMIHSMGFRKFWRIMF